MYFLPFVKHIVSNVVDVATFKVEKSEVDEVCEGGGDSAREFIAIEEELCEES